MAVTLDQILASTRLDLPALSRRRSAWSGRRRTGRRPRSAPRSAVSGFASWPR